MNAVNSNLSSAVDLTASQCTTKDHNRGLWPRAIVLNCSLRPFCPHCLPARGHHQFITFTTSINTISSSESLLVAPEAALQNNCSGHGVRWHPETCVCVRIVFLHVRAADTHTSHVCCIKPLKLVFEMLNWEHLLWQANRYSTLDCICDSPRNKLNH